MRVGNGSSKYDYDDEQFDKDVKDKREITENFILDIVNIMSKDVRYHDNMPISREQRKICMIEAYKRVYDKL